ncbi:MAG: hypothetical protein KME26_09945 [Oscillatoria princeps RMCB-10]|jgi:hypothetical protein|nr:hypothetical protein [Oscillatoria princeps RMCB-10]
MLPADELLKEGKSGLLYSVAGSLQSMPQGDLELNIAAPALRQNCKAHASSPKEIAH